MEFNPNNKVINLCLQGTKLESEGSFEEAKTIFLLAWNESENDTEKYIASFFLSKFQNSITEELKWLKKSLNFAQKANTESATLSSLYSKIAGCYQSLNKFKLAKLNLDLAKKYCTTADVKGPFYHGTKADLQIGELLKPGGVSNYQSDLKMNHIYFTSLVNGAGLAASLANGKGKERVYIVEPTGSFENDPNVTDKKFPGNPTRSYRSEAPLKIIDEIADWLKHDPVEIQEWREKINKNTGEIIN